MANFLPAGYEDEYSDDSDDLGFSYYQNKSSPNKSSTVSPESGDANQNCKAYENGWNNPIVDPIEGWNDPIVDPIEGWTAEKKWNDEQIYDDNIYTPLDLSSKLQSNVQLPIDDLRIAILNGDLETTRQYIENGIDVNIVLKSNWTPLLYASNAAQPEIVKYLLEKEACVNYNKADMFTPLLAACMSNPKEESHTVQCIVHLVEHGANVNCMDRFHSTPLMHAANSGRLLALQKLLEYGADPNLIDTHGWTALFYAANGGYMSTVAELKKAGVNIKHRDNRKDSAADIAYSRAFDQIAAYLDDIYKPIDDDSSSTEKVETDPCMEKTEMPECYGELELFLHGLELGSYIELFHQHQVSFHQMLQLEDLDLEKMGIMKVGARKKIVDAIRAVHKKDWQTTSLMKIQYDTSIRCSDAAAMLANISRHTLYIKSTIGYIGDQVRINPEMITETYDTKLLKQLLHYMNEAQQNSSKLLIQLDKLDHEIKTLTERKNLEPIGHITESSIVKKQRLPSVIAQTQHKLLMTMTVGLMGLMLWKKNLVIDKFFLFSGQLQRWLNLK